MGARTVIQFPPGKSARILKWTVKEGSYISLGRVILLYDLDPDSGGGEQKKLKAKTVGVVSKLLVKEGDIIEPGHELLELEDCSHATVMNAMCAECGADLREDESQSEVKASVPMVHSIPELKVSKEQAETLGKADEERLLGDRKLVLLVDLDQTLIHTTNDNIPPNLKDVYHFQLYGPQSPWYHTRIRPGTQKFLSEMSKLYELHICTFGARNYAHTIAMFLDPDGRYFSHRILSRDECFSQNSKTANLKALFPCGDNLVCIIDDREDVWNYAANLIHVKPYHFFQHTGDINAPPGLAKCENDDKEGFDFSKFGEKMNKMSVKEENKNGKNEHQERDNCVPDLKKNTEETSTDATVVESVLTNGLDEVSVVEEPNTETNLLEESLSDLKEPLDDVRSTEKNLESMDELNKDNSDGINKSSSDGTNDSNGEMNKGSIGEINKESGDEVIEESNHETNKECSEETNKECSVETNKESGSETNKESSETNRASGEISSETNRESGEIISSETNRESGEIISSETSVCVVNSSPTEDRTPEQNNSNGDSVKEPEIETKKSEGQKLEDIKDTSEQNSDVVELEDGDDYLMYLEEILRTIHHAFYELFDQLGGKVPDLKLVVPYVRRKVLTGTSLVLSGLVPTHVPLESSRVYQLAVSLGAEVTPTITSRSTHLVAVRPGTAKVHQARKEGLGKIKLVNPEWLWSCAERWEHVDERLFPLQSKGASQASRHPPAHCGSPNRLGRFMDTINPLMSFSSEEIANMDKEVEDIFNESESGGETKSEKVIEDSSSDTVESLSEERPHGWKEPKPKRRAEDLDEDSPSSKFRRGEALPSDLDLGDEDSVGSDDPPDEVDDGDWNMMGAALEREFLSGE